MKMTKKNYAKSQRILNDHAIMTEDVDTDYDSESESEDDASDTFSEGASDEERWEPEEKQLKALYGGVVRLTDANSSEAWTPEVQAAVKKEMDSMEREGDGVEWSGVRS